MTSKITQIRDLDKELLALVKMRFEAVYGERGSDGSTTGRSYAELEALEDTWRSAQSRIDSYIVLQKTLHNHKTLPHRLPQEILTSIFRIAAYDSEVENARDGNPWYHRQLRSFMMVSTSWRSLIVQTPSLWVACDLLYSSGLIRHILARSSQHPLDVRIDTSSRRRWVVQSELTKNSIDSVFRCRDRLRTLDIIIGSHDIPQFAPLLASPLPQTEALRLIISSSGRYNRFAGLDLSNKPKIRELSLGGFGMDWNHVNLPNLETLHLQDIGKEPKNPLSLRRFLGSLQKSPGLKSLAPTNVEFADDLLGITYDARNVVVPFLVLPLTRLDIQLSKTSVVHHILLAIAGLPQCETLQIRTACSNMKETNMVGKALAHVLSVATHLIPGECSDDAKASTNLELRYSGGMPYEWVHRYFTIDPFEAPGSCDIRGFTFQTTHPRGNLEDVLYIVNATRQLYTTGPMDITLPNPVDWNKPEIQSFFEALPVSSLCVVKSTYSRSPSRITSLLQYLGGESLPDGRVSDPLPHPERLTLRDTDDVTASRVVEMLKSRQQLPQDQDSPGSDSLRPFFLSLAGQLRDVSVIQEIRSILGERFLGFEVVEPRFPSWGEPAHQWVDWSPEVGQQLWEDGEVQSNSDDEW